MNLNDLDQMLGEKGNPCISIILPTIKYTRERIQNPGLIEKAVHKAGILLTHSAWPKSQILDMQSKLDSLLEKKDYMSFQEGLAVFISPNVFKIYVLPINVKEKVTIGKSFEVRDLHYFSQFLKPYLLLAISKKRIRLFKGSGRDLQEIVNDDFPKHYVDEYEYARPSIGSASSFALKGFERDKSILVKVRMNAFFTEADHALAGYLKHNHLLFIAGVKEELADFEHLTRHVTSIVGRIPGNYDVDAVHPLAETAWKKIRENVLFENQQLLTKLEESIGKHLVVDGIRDVWKAAKEGKGLTLLLEKDYQITGYVDRNDDNHLFLSAPHMKHHIIADAADDVIEVVKQKGGTVAVVENGELLNHQHIALLLRY